MAENKTDSIGNKIKKAMRQAKVTQEELGKKVGVSQSQINHWVSDRRIPTLKSMQEIALALGKPIEFFTTKIEQPTQEFIEQVGYEVGLIPVKGISSATDEKFIMEETEAFIPIKSTNKDLFALRVEGNCMVDPDDPQNSIYHGNYVIIDRNEIIEEEDVVLARISAEYSTIKRLYYKDADTIELVPDNPKCKTLVRKKRDVQIVGKVVNVYRPIKKKRRRQEA